MSYGKFDVYVDAFYNFTKVIDKNDYPLIGLMEPGDIKERLEVFEDKKPVDNFFNTNNFNHVYGEEIRSNKTLPPEVHKKELALGAISKYRDHLETKPDTLYKTHLNGNGDDRLYIAINPKENNWSLLEIRKRKKSSILK